jgi:Ni/Fe-hydrogenase subunit HybB-like protein
MSGTLMSLLILESVLTAAAVMMVLYRGMLDMREEDHVILDDAENHLAREQASIRQKVTALSKYIKVLGVAWGVLLVTILGVWVVQGLNLM